MTMNQKSKAKKNQNSKKKIYLNKALKVQIQTQDWMNQAVKKVNQNQTNPIRRNLLKFQINLAQIKIIIKSQGEQQR